MAETGDVLGSALTGDLGLLGDEVDEVVDLEDVTAGKDTGLRGHSHLVDLRAAGDHIHVEVDLLGELVLGDKSAG